MKIITINEVVKSESFSNKVHESVTSTAGSIIRKVTVRFQYPVWDLKGYSKPVNTREDYFLKTSLWGVTVEGCGKAIAGRECGKTVTRSLTIEAMPPVKEGFDSFDWTKMTEEEKSAICAESEIVFDFSENYEANRQESTDFERRMSALSRNEFAH